MKSYRFKVIAAVMIVLTICFSACRNTDDSAVVVNDTLVTFEDALGHKVTVDNPKRVAVCMGSFAEVWLLAGGELDCVTQDAYDEHLFKVPDTAINIGHMKSPSIEMMIGQNIDFVILSSKISEHVDMYDTLKSAGITAVYFNVDTFGNYLAMLKACTDITGRSDLYQRNGAEIQAEIDEAIKKSTGQKSPVVLYIRAFSTGAKAKGSDSMTGAMLDDLGCINVADTDNSLLDNLSIEAIIKADPDYIFVTSMGSDEDKALQNLKSGIKSNPAWSELSAVKNDRYIVLPKSLYHYKPNAKWGEAYKELAEILYGE